MKAALLRDNPGPKKLEKSPAGGAVFTYDSLLKDIEGIPELGKGPSPNFRPLERLRALRDHISGFTEPRERRNLELAFDRRAVSLFESNFAADRDGPPPKTTWRKDWLKERREGFNSVIGGFPFFDQETKRDLLNRAK